MTENDKPKKYYEVSNQFGNIYYEEQYKVLRLCAIHSAYISSDQNVSINYLFDRYSSENENKFTLVQYYKVLSFSSIFSMIYSLIYFKIKYGSSKKFTSITHLLNKIKYLKTSRNYTKRLKIKELKNLSDIEIDEIKLAYRSELYFTKQNLPYIIHNKVRYDLLDSERNPINEKLYNSIVGEMICYKDNKCGPNMELPVVEVHPDYLDEPIKVPTSKFF